MKPTVFAALTLVVSACGAMPDADALPPIDESACSKDRLEADGRDSNDLTALPKGQYVVSTTYLRLPLRRSAVARFQELSAPMEDELRANPGLVRVTTRVAGSCNTARTLSVWKSEADMYRFVGSPAHARAMAAVAEVSRGGSVTTHWTATEAEATWATATQKLAEDTDGPVY
jgi:quinol monooxygenase YgiN